MSGPRFVRPPPARPEGLPEAPADEGSALSDGIVEAAPSATIAPPIPRDRGRGSAPQLVAMPSISSLMRRARRSSCWAAAAMAL